MSTLSKRRTATAERHQQIRELAAAGRTIQEIAARIGMHPAACANIIRDQSIETPGDVQRNSRRAVEARRARIRELAATGHTIDQIAAAVGMSRGRTAELVNRLRIMLPAAKTVTRNRARPDRMLDAIVLDAEVLTAAIDLIDYAGLDQGRLPAALVSLEQSRAALARFITRLRKETHAHGHHHHHEAIEHTEHTERETTAALPDRSLADRYAPAIASGFDPTPL